MEGQGRKGPTANLIYFHDDGESMGFKFWKKGDKKEEQPHSELAKLEVPVEM